MAVQFWRNRLAWLTVSLVISNESSLTILASNNDIPLLHLRNDICGCRKTPRVTYFRCPDYHLTTILFFVDLFLESIFSWFCIISFFFHFVCVCISGLFLILKNAEYINNKMVPVRSQKLALRNNSPILFEFVQTFTYTYQFKLLKILKYWKFKTGKERFRTFYKSIIYYT